MYQAVNDRIIVKKPSEQTTESGIILSEQDSGAVFTFEVVSTPPDDTRFKGKTILAERRHVVELPGKDGSGKYGALKADEVIAVKE